MSWKFDLGSEVKCRHTGFHGVVMARADHLNGCNRYSIHPPVDKDGKLPDSYWFDEASLDLVRAPVEKAKPVVTGGAHSRKM